MGRWVVLQLTQFCAVQASSYWCKPIWPHHVLILLFPKHLFTSLCLHCMYTELFGLGVMHILQIFIHSFTLSYLPGAISNKTVLQFYWRVSWPDLSISRTGFCFSFTYEFHDLTFSFPGGVSASGLQKSFMALPFQFQEGFLLQFYWRVSWPDLSISRRGFCFSFTEEFHDLTFLFTGGFSSRAVLQPCRRAQWSTM